MCLIFDFSLVFYECGSISNLIHILSREFIKVPNFSLPLSFSTFFFLMYQLACALIRQFIVLTIAINSSFIIKSNYLNKFNSHHFEILVSFIDLSVSLSEDL